jgi:8-amino-7-oxononanoate synthase
MTPIRPPFFSPVSAMETALLKRREMASFRSLSTAHSAIDFSSNDYLGFALSDRFRQIIASFGAAALAPGSTGSRLLRGNSLFAETLEESIAAFHHAQAGLIFNSGYDANLGLFSSIASRGDTIIYDSLIHASIRDGVRLSGARAFNFSHNNTSQLNERLKAADGKGQVFVAVESVYSMDGDEAPLREIAALCKLYGANLVVDEAHATGVKGAMGQGLVYEAGLCDDVFARVHTFGKALGCHGAIVLGSRVLRDWLINYSRSFIYTTALPPASLAAISSAYQLIQENPAVISDLANRILQFRKDASCFGVVGLLPSFSPIQCVLIPGNKEVREVAGALQKAGLDVRPILSPTVQSGKERLRICIHAFNSPAEINGLASHLGKLKYADK